MKTNTLTVRLAIYKLAFVFTAAGKGKRAFALDFIVLEIADIHIAIGEIEYATAMLVIVFVNAVVFVTVGIEIRTTAMVAT